MNLCKINNNLEYMKTREVYELERILETENINIVFQPIVCLKDGSIIGYEALTRGPKDSLLHSPNKLFSVAHENNKTFEIEYLCGIKTLEKARSIIKDKLLFFNIDPINFKDERFVQCFTKDFLEKYDLYPEAIIFEITEKTAIQDYKSFKNVLNNYKNQGYKIALDDTGAGYSGLKTLSQTKPHYIKIDIELIKDIDKDSFKQSILKSFVSLSESNNMKLIAEGIETKEELLTLMNLGVYAGQGYFLEMPSSTPTYAPENLLSIIEDHKNSINHTFSNNFSDQHVGQIAVMDKIFYESSPCIEVQNYFTNNSATGVCIVRDNYPVGLVMKHSLDSSLATQYGFAVFSKRPISLVMDKKPLIVNYYDSVSDVSKAAMSRSMVNLYDYVIVTKDNNYYGTVTIKSLLEYATQIQCNYAKQLNPLTGLPGNIIIEHTMTNLITNNRTCGIFYFDLDNFKAYNDVYGFENGDNIIKFTAELIQNKLKAYFEHNSFLGHVGGDDFVCIIESSPEKCNEFCEVILNEFDAKILHFFNEAHRRLGYIESTDRHNNKVKFKLTSISIAGVYGNYGSFSNAMEISQYISSIKTNVKKIAGSSYIIDKSYLK